MLSKLAMNLLNFRTYTSGLPPTYTAIALLPLAAEPSANPWAINNSAVVGGNAEDAGGNIVAVRWTLTSPRHLGTFGGATSTVFGISDTGLLCGSATTPDGSEQAALWDRGLIRNLGTLSGVSGSSVAYAISDGPPLVVYGVSSNSSNTSHAVRWENLSIEVLPEESDWVSSAARAIGPNGNPAGTATRNSGQSVAVYWNPGPVILPGLSGSVNAEVLAGKSSGVLVGQSNAGASTPHEAVFFTEGSSATSMQTIPGTYSSSAAGVNRHSVAVGTYGGTDASGNRFGGGFVFARYGGAAMVDLTARLAPGGPVIKILVAYDINEDGIITALGEDSNGLQYGVLLLPN
jgi:uncharacterized membrane protein